MQINKNIKKVVIVGGGISGLATAYFIKIRAEQAGISLQMQIIEKELQPGGKIRSIRDNGYLYEWGPNGFLDNKPQTLSLCSSLGIMDQLLVSNDNARKRFIYSNKKLHQLPHTPGKFLTSSLLSIGGRLRVLAEPFIDKLKDPKDESLASFARRRLGQEALDKLITPMASGIFAANPETMSLKSCFPRIYELEQQYGSLIKAFRQIGKARKNEQENKDDNNKHPSPAGPGGKLTSFTNGLQTLIDALAAAIGADNIINEQVTSIEKYGDGLYQIITHNGTYTADVVVSAAPSYVAAEIIGKAVDAQLGQLLSTIKYAPLVVVCSSYETKNIKHDLNGFGYLLASDETIPVLGSLWDSSIFANRAPDGKILFRTMLGGARYPNLVSLNDTEISNIVRESFSKILGIKIDPDIEQIFRHEKAIPEYNLGHEKMLFEIEERLKFLPGIFLTGNAYHGVGINDCVLAADKTADKIMDYLQSYTSRL